ncbi:hypothetical protein BH11PLA2_BH11PLA2_34500 [soil metagenome]
MPQSTSPAQTAAPIPNRNYGRLKENARARNAELSQSGRDIAPLPEIVDPERRASGVRDLQLFCETYFPQTFRLGWSDDHRRVILKIQIAILSGGLFAMAMPRGSGKTSLIEVACIWAGAYGHRDYIALIGASQTNAEAILGSIRSELEQNELLLEDFPALCYPIRCLEGIANRCSGQIYQGERTLITWTDRTVILPTIADSLSSGIVMRCAGLTGSIRGWKHKRADGKSVRPSLVVLDDPQTDGSARSVKQCERRESILSGAILGLAGPGVKISGIMPCTVIQRGDMADRILDREKHPQWQGERTKMVYAFPSNEKLWGQYADLRSESLREGRGPAEANAFYAAHREAMDAGAIVAWPERHNSDELSGIQHAMNLRADRGEESFNAEYQNDPSTQEAEDTLTIDQICAKLSKLKSGVVPLGADHLVSYFDVQKKCLWYMVVAWASDFTGQIVDYGTYPDQQRSQFTLRDARRTLQQQFKGQGLEGQIYSGLTALSELLLGKQFPLQAGGVGRIERALIDAQWGDSTDVVYKFCQESKYASILLPSHGKGIRAGNIPYSAYKKQKGLLIGENWLLKAPAGKRAIRHLLIDTNWWKSFTYARLQSAMGDRGSLSLFGAKADEHRLLAAHLLAEARTKTFGQGREVDEWTLPADRPDNHWWDCLTGCGVAGSMLGCAILRPKVQKAKPKARKKPAVTYF